MKARLKNIVARTVTPALKERGFKKAGDRFVRGDAVVQLVDVQFSRWDNPNEASFTLNCGVWMSGVTSTYRNTAEPASPKLADCCISARVGMLTDSRLDVWWTVRQDDPSELDESTERAVVTALSGAVLPFLRRFETAEAIAEFLSAPLTGPDRLLDPRAEVMRVAYATAAWATLGQAARRDECLARATALAKTGPVKDIIAGFASRVRGP